jgi:ATP-binding cassette subfamily B protein
MSVGDFVAFVQAMGSAVMSIERISMLIVRTQETCVVIRRVFSLIDEPEEVESGPTQLQGIRYGVAFDKVTFTYPGQYRPALSRVSFEVHAGEKIALMGPSGSGKSTILWLLLRFYDPQQGLISIDGTDIRDIDISSLRTHICMVQQEPTIFSGSLRDNIAYGREASDTSSIQEAAQMAEIHDFASSLTHGYDTPVGESGVTLSGGQKQRVALAASLLTEPEILLLDDTTSALDAQTEKRIQQTLHTVLQHKTSMVITHRIATAAVCSRIIVLEDGHIIQQGTHRELQKHPGFYRRICEQQNRAADIEDTPAC